MQHASSHADARSPALPVGFAELYTETYDFVWRCALRLGADPTTVEDIVHDSYIVALRRFDSFDPDAGVRPRTWLFGILRNVLRNHARAERRRQARLEHYRQMPRRVPRARADATLASRLVDDFLATLDADKRAVFVLGEIEGMTGPEVAAALELNLNTANSRLRSARKAFARHFADDDANTLEALAEVRRARAPAQVRRHGLPLVVGAAGYSFGGGATGVLLAGLGWKLAGLLFAVAGAVAGVIVMTADPVPELAERSRPVDDPPAPSSRAATNDTPPDPIPVLVESPEPEPAPPSAQPPAKPLEPNPDRRELERLQDARAALLTSDPARALELVEGRSLDGALERRRASLEISALCQLDRASEAERRSRAWRAAHPDDPLVSSFVGVCWTE